MDRIMGRMSFTPLASHKGGRRLGPPPAPI
jgi:hypothetical protein